MTQNSTKTTGRAITEEQQELAVANLVENHLNKMNYDLVRVNLINQTNSNVIQIMVEHPPQLPNENQPSEAKPNKTCQFSTNKPVTLDDCERITHDLLKLFELKPPLADDNYTVEVSSPGLDRFLVRDRDLHNYKQFEVTVKLKKTTSLAVTVRQKKIDGFILDYSQDSIVLQTENKDSLENIIDAETQKSENYKSRISKIIKQSKNPQKRQKRNKASELRKITAENFCAIKLAKIDCRSIKLKMTPALFNWSKNQETLPM